jgi:hypothetical protein
MKAKLCITITFAALINFANFCLAEDFFVAPARSQEPNHLTPTSQDSEYRRLIKKSLLTYGINSGAFCSLPAFEGESCFEVTWELNKTAQNSYEQEVKRADSELEKDLVPISDDPKDHDYFITVSSASENLSYAENEETKSKTNSKVKITRNTRAISKELAAAIQRTWAKMLLQTKYPKSFSRGNDGVTYLFSVWIKNLGTLEGETWAPRKGLVREIVENGEAITNFASETKGDEQPILKRLKNLESKIDLS